MDIAGLLDDMKERVRTRGATPLVGGGLLGSFTRGLLGLDPSEEDSKFSQDMMLKAYQTGQALSNTPTPLALAVAPAALVKGAKSAKKALPQEKALETARKNAELVGQSLSTEQRMLQHGFEPNWFHGTTGDISKFRTDLLGESTGAESAKKAFFFARDPQNPPEKFLKKTTNQESIDMLKKLGISDAEIAKLNEVSLSGHGAETASGYAALGGSRQYKEAMRKAKAAEKNRNWAEYENWTQIAEDAAIGKSQNLQDLVAKYGEKRDLMLDSINNAILNKTLPQAQQVVLDEKIKQLMPYGWYNSYSIPQLKALKGEIANLAGKSKETDQALKNIDDFISTKAERQLAESYEEGSNVLPVALRYKNPFVYDFGGSTYRDQTYSDLIDQARRGGHDALIMKNTFDPGAGPAKLVDIAAVFDPKQVRSRFAAFDPKRINDPDLLASLAAFGVGIPTYGLLEEE